MTYDARLRDALLRLDGVTLFLTRSGQWQASTKMKGGDGWCVNTRDAPDEAFLSALGLVEKASDKQDTEDVFS